MIRQNFGENCSDTEALFDSVFLVSRLFASDSFLQAEYKYPLCGTYTYAIRVHSWAMRLRASVRDVCNLRVAAVQLAA